MGLDNPTKKINHELYFKIYKQFKSRGGSWHAFSCDVWGYACNYEHMRHHVNNFQLF